MASNYNFTVDQRTDWTFTLSDFSYNITGYDYEMNIREAKEINSTLIEDISPYITNNGSVVTVAVPDTVTRDWDFGEAYYDIVETSDTGVVTRIVQGKVFLDTAVTDETIGD